MLQNEIPAMDIISERNKLEPLLPDEVKEYFHTTPEKMYHLEYPVLQYPKKVNSLSLDKTPVFNGKLAGIKGQYLLFEDGTVFNIRTFEGYVVKITL